MQPLPSLKGSHSSHGSRRALRGFSDKGPLPPIPPCPARTEARMQGPTHEAPSVSVRMGFHMLPCGPSPD